MNLDFLDQRLINYFNELKNLKNDTEALLERSPECGFVWKCVGESERIRGILLVINQFFMNINILVSRGRGLIKIKEVEIGWKTV